MTKAELIERYGIEWYEQHKERMKTRMRERYHNDPEYKVKQTKYCCHYQRERYKNDEEYRTKIKLINNKFNKDNRSKQQIYVKDNRIDLIENYELAEKDEFKGWHIHHRNEIKYTMTGDIEITSADELKADNKYYNCPPEDLIWIPAKLHNKLHYCANSLLDIINILGMKICN